MDNAAIAPAKNTPTHRCAGCAEHTAPEKYTLCNRCVGVRPTEDYYTGDVGFEGGDFA